MPSYKVKVKWNKQVFDDVKVDPSKGAKVLKEALYQLTGVPAERQKVMAKGLWKGTLKDDQGLDELDWKDGMLVAMMGTSEGIPKPPEEKTVFVEDMSTADKQKVAYAEPPGLDNLGNTCYMNSTLQCLRAVPEIRASLESAPLSPGSQDVSEQMVAALRDLYKEMDGNDDHVTPMRFVQTMRLTFPQFAQQGPRGGYAQQDSDEFYNELMGVLGNKLTRPGAGVDFGGKSNAVEALFGIELTTELKCIESEDEPVSRGADTQRRLQCTITSDVVTLEEGLKLGMESEIEKTAETLKRNALFKQTRRINSLPKYLTIQLNRFFWKRTPESRDHQGVNCKILKPVKFSTVLDVFNLCDAELQAVLKGPRDKRLRERMGREAKADGDVAMADGAGAEDDDELQAALRLSLGESAEGAGASKSSRTSAGIGLPSDFTGTYELFAVTTHKGRASDSGHYMGWVRQRGDDWVVFDDETASHCKTEDIMQLQGGGDYDLSYQLWYRAKLTHDDEDA